MLVEVYRKCYNFAGYRDEFKVIPYNCPMQMNNYDLSVFNENEINRKFCFGGLVWIGEESPVYDTKFECKCYDKDSFKPYDNRVECNFYLGMDNGKQEVLHDK